MLKKIRLIVAVVMLALITFYFLDFAAILPQGFPNLARIQFFPALLSGSFIVLAILLVATLLFGRIYCSVICPMGIFQDFVTWISQKFNRKKYFRFSEEKRWVRYGVLCGTIIIFLLGATVVLSLLDPYSAYARIVVNVFRPLYMEGNNLLAAIFNHFGNYTFYHTDVFILGMAALVVGLLTLVVIVFLSWKYGRTWCNVICPVGTILGLLSRFSLWKVRIDPQACVACGLCERKCKASCIDSKAKKIDYSRCIDCYNCLQACHKHALVYKMRDKKVETEAVADSSKRQFMATLALTALAVPSRVFANGVEAGGNSTKEWKRENPLSPPGAVSTKHLLRHCTACHLCVAKCPSRVLKPAFMEYGLEGMMQPKMDFEHGFCNFDCTVCADICPNSALLKLTKEEKHRLQVGKVVFVLENCIVHTQETSCGACSEHCPTQAVSMQPYKNGLTIPVVNPDICVGCGGCEYVCPVRPFRAIYIEGNPVHQQALPFKEAEKKALDLDGFGF